MTTDIVNDRIEKVLEGNRCAGYVAGRRCHRKEQDCIWKRYAQMSKLRVSFSSESNTHAEAKGLNTTDIIRRDILDFELVITTTPQTVATAAIWIELLPLEV